MSSFIKLYIIKKKELVFLTFYLSMYFIRDINKEYINQEVIKVFNDLLFK
jgi:hypothetical protein